MTEVGVVVGRVSLDLEELIFGRHSRFDSLLLLALDTAHAATPLKACICEALG